MFGCLNVLRALFACLFFPYKISAKILLGGGMCACICVFVHTHIFVLNVMDFNSLFSILPPPQMLMATNPFFPLL